MQRLLFAMSARCPLKDARRFSAHGADESPNSGHRDSSYDARRPLTAAFFMTLYEKSPGIGLDGWCKEPPALAVFHANREFYWEFCIITRLQEHFVCGGGFHAE